MLMLWYGYNSKINKLINKQKTKQKSHLLRFKWEKSKKIQLNKQTLVIYKPPFWNLIFSKNVNKNLSLIFFYSETYFFKVSIPDRSIQLKYDRNTSLITLHTLYLNNNYRLFLTHLNQVFSAFYKPNFIKIKFKGKGYYIYKNKRNTITPQFGYSHRLYLYSYFVSVKFLSKTSVFVFGLLKTDILKIGFGIKAMRPINIFTGRGVRFARQIVYKKVGKVSSYR